MFEKLVELIEPPDEEKIINESLIKIKDAIDTANETALEKIFKEAELKLGQPLGKAYQAFKGKCSINPVELIRSACHRQQNNIIILFGEARFDFNVIVGKTFFGSDMHLLHVALRGTNPDLLNILTNFGIRLNQFSIDSGVNFIFYQDANVNKTHHLASLGGMVTDKQHQQLSKAHQQAYDLGRKFGEDYKNTIESALQSFLLNPISEIVIEYLGKSLSIPWKKFNVIQSKFITVEQPDSLTESNSSFFQVTENKREPGEIYRAANEFDSWIEKCEPVDLFCPTHNVYLLRWIQEDGGKFVQNYRKFRKLVSIVSQKGYHIDPHPSAEEFNQAIQAYFENANWIAIASRMSLSR